ncbi:MAG: Ca(2+)/H(+) antiporter [Ktedonobacterales bacterium]|jgi:Ca2+:H+ antiporter|nr:MAG: Ca(2+)/H(+) antiporter [Ktedonobacterales bacterium]
MSRWLYILLIALPAAIIAEALHAPPLAVFILAGLALVPLAGLIGVATEVLAERMGERIGGLLNATFGNAAEIIIGIAAIRAGLPDVVRASIAGSIIGNALLVLGTAMLVGGWRYGLQRFDARTAGQYAAMLALAVVGLGIPTLLTIVGEGPQPGTDIIQGQSLHTLSYLVAVILLACYVAYIAFSVFGLRATPTDGHRRASSAPAKDSALTEPPRERPASPSPHHQSPAPAPSASAPLTERFAYLWQHTLWLPILVLAAVTALTAVASEILVGTIEPVATEVGLSPFFVGLIVLPIVGNAAEHFTAITMALRNQMEVSLAITAGSSIQIALLAAPVLVLLSPLLGSPLDLNFTILEVATFGLVAGIFALISLDGESTWLEGLLLCAFYLILAVGVFVTPVPIG